MKTQFVLAIAWLATAVMPQAADTAGSNLEALRQYESGGNVAVLRHYEQWVAQAVGDPAARQKLESELAEALTGQATFEARRFVCTQLAIIGTEASVPAAARLLESDETVGIACLALAKNPSTQAGQVLREALERLKGQALVQVINTLGTRRDREAVNALLDFAKNEDRAVAGAAYLALGKIGGSTARTALAEARQKNDPAVADAVAAGSFLFAERLVAQNRRPGAVRIYDQLLAADHADHVRRGAFEALLRLDEDGGLQRASEALTGAEKIFKPSAIAAVATMQNAEASKGFAALLPNLEPTHQALLLEALAERGDAEARKAVAAEVDSPHALVRSAAISNLGRIGTASDVPLLAQAALFAAGLADRIRADESNVPELAQAAQAAKGSEELKLIEIALAGLQGGAAVDQALIAQLRNRMAGPKTPFLAALVRRANPSSLRVFLVEAGSTSPDMVKLAFQGLTRVGTAEDVPSVLKALGGLRAESVRAEAMEATSQLLSRVGAPSANAAAIRAALEAAPSLGGMQTYLPLLAVCPDAEGLDLVAKSAADADSSLRDIGLRTLADWPDASAWGPLSDCYSKAASETERVLVLRGLTRLLGEQNAHPNPEVVARYRTLLAGAKTDTDRKLILGALAGCHHPDALTVAVEQVAQPGAQGEAKLAVQRIGEAIKAQHPEAAAAALKQIEGK
ncbi:MAG TPA: HEAT repeat domain-containing protein [Candidatus Paceibacterota bacterium]|nr:HEAT repeat domain-containing protein [Candidatus Paceibacterota bacterium]HRZ54038.1 HEAT repeat domain-containing protein [Candidatus Paceibacterota bacterium]